MNLDNAPEVVIKKVDPEEVNPGEEKQDDPEKTFTQTELNEIVEKRLARAKAEKPDDYDDLLAIASVMEEYGFTGTAAEKRAALKAVNEKNRTERELQEINEEAEKTGHSPEIIKELKDAKKKNKEAQKKLDGYTKIETEKQKVIEAQEEADANWERQFKEFVESHEDIDIDELVKDAKFVKYAKKHTGELTEIYDDYLELMESNSQSIADKFKKSESRSTGGGKNIPSSGNIKLSTETQKTMDDWNKRYPKNPMTPKDFT